MSIRSAHISCGVQTLGRMFGPSDPHKLVGTPYLGKTPINLIVVEVFQVLQLNSNIIRVARLIKLLRHLSVLLSLSLLLSNSSDLLLVVDTCAFFDNNFGWLSFAVFCFIYRLRGCLLVLLGVV